MSTLKFSLISDMHVDFPQEKTPYDLLESVVIVAGDTSNGLVGLSFLRKLERKGYSVLAVDGNHEHYSNLSQGRDVEETTARFREQHQSEFDEDFIGVPVVLRNGWYPVTSETQWLKYMNDGHRACLSASEANRRSVQSAEYIRSTLETWRKYQKKGIVVTHTAPCEETLNPEYRDDWTNQWYWNPAMRPLLKEFSDEILVWCHGHSHASMDEVVDGTRVVCNPRGYPGENPGWVPKTIEVVY